MDTGANRALRAAELLRRAETRLAEAGLDPDPDLKVQEWQVMQVELELQREDLAEQNRELRRLRAESEQGQAELRAANTQLKLDLGERERAEARARSLWKLYSALSQTNHAILRVREERALFQRICDIASEFGEFILAWIGLEDAEARELRVVASSGPALGYLDGLRLYSDPGSASGRGPALTAMRQGRPVVINDFQVDPMTGPWQPQAGRFGIAASASFPISRSGRAVGALVVYAQRPGFFDSEKVALLVEMADALSFALEALDREAARRVTEEKFARMFQLCPDAIDLADLDTGEIREFNANFAKLYGYTSEEIQGRTTLPGGLGILAPEDRARHIAELKAAGESLGRELRLRRKDGSTFTGIISSALLEIGGSRYCISITRDITERKQAEEALNLSQERLSLTLASARMGTFAVDLQSGERLWDATTFRMLGIDPDRFGGSLPEVLAAVHPADRELLAARLRGAQEESRFEVEYRVIWPDGTTHHLAARGKVFPDEQGRLANLVGVLWDITERKQAEESLAQERIFTRALLDNLVEGVLACDDQGHPVLANRTLREWQGLHGTGAGPDRGVDLGHPVEVEVDETTPMTAETLPLTRAFNGEVFRDATMTVRAPGQPPRHLHCNGSPILDPEHRRLGAVVVMHDVTGQRRADEDLRKISVAMAQSPVSVVITDAQGAIEYVNPKFTQLTGYSAAEVLGRNPRVLKTGEFPPESYARLWATISAGEVWKGEFHNRKKDGGLFWEAATIAPIKAGDGRITGYVALKEDITEHKVAEQARRESETRFRELFETSKDGIAMVDPEGRFLDCNRAFLDLLGLERKEELLSRSFEAFTPAEYVEPERKLIAQCQEPGHDGGQDFEKEYLTESGLRIPVELRFWTRRDEAGKVTGLWTTVRNITERQQAKKLLEQLNGELEARVHQRTVLLETANAELDAFSYSVSHDLRAPLRGIDGFSLALLEEFGEGLPGQAKHYLQRVRAGTQRMGQLIDDLLQLSRVSRSVLNARRLDLSALALSLLEEIRQTDPSRGLEIRVEEGLVARGDRGLIRSVLENVLGNAWKYTAKVPQARIEVFRTLLPDGRAAFCVRDNGAGFDMAYAGKLFVPFQRLHSSHDYEGTGIGLAIVQRIIQRHGGEIWAEAEVGKGATFTFRLPD
jgi:PAS domain S-box-containing protein